MTRPKEQPTAPTESTGGEARPEPPWNVILHNSWHPMSWVVWVLKKTIPGMGGKKATKLMLTSEAQPIPRARRW